MLIGKRQLLHILCQVCDRSDDGILCSEMLRCSWDGQCHDETEVLTRFCEQNNIVLPVESALEGNSRMV